MARWAVALLALLALLAACMAAPTPSRPNLGIANGTALTVTLVVNGQPIGEYKPGGDPFVDVSSRPPLPWDVEARSPTGRVLTSMHVEPGQVSSTHGSDGAAQARRPTTRRVRPAASRS